MAEGRDERGRGGREEKKLEGEGTQQSADE